jgi:hypothetical protein
MLYPMYMRCSNDPNSIHVWKFFDYNELKIACAFPRENGKPMNWGNFPEYQQGKQFALNTEDMQKEGNAFLKYVGRSLFGSLGKSLSDFFLSPPSDFRHHKRWVNYFLKPI